MVSRPPSPSPLPEYRYTHESPSSTTSARRNPFWHFSHLHEIAQKDTMTALYAGFHLARSLIELGRYADAKSLMLPLQRGLDSRVEQRPLMRRVYAEALYKTKGASRDEVIEAATILEDVLSLMRRRCGAGHPGTVETLTELDRARMTLEDKF